MENDDERLVEMVIKDIDSVFDVEKLIDGTTFDDMLTDLDKVDRLFLAFQHMRMILVEKNGVHEILAMVTPEEAGLLTLANEYPQDAESSLAFQTILLLRKLGVTLEKTVVWGKQDFEPLTKLYMRAADGTEMDMDLRLADALCISLLAKIPFYVSGKYMKEQERPEFTKKAVPNGDVVLLHMLPEEDLPKEMEKALRTENYEYAELVKNEMNLRDEKRKKESENK